MTKDDIVIVGYLVNGCLVICANADKISYVFECQIRDMWIIEEEYMDADEWMNEWVSDLLSDSLTHWLTVCIFVCIVCITHSIRWF